MKGINIAETCHVVPIIEPLGSAAATKNSLVWSMENYAHVSIILQVGTQAGSFTAILYECDDHTPTNATAIATHVYKEETASTDVLGARATMAAAGLATAETSNIFYVIEHDASELTDGYPCMQLRLSALDNTTYVSAVAILSGPRYISTESATAIS